MSDRRPDPEGLREQVAMLHARASTILRTTDVELFARASHSVRLCRRRGDEHEVIEGTEEGLAIRVRSGQGIAFAATSGVGEAALEAALSMLGGGYLESSAAEAPWAGGAIEAEEDHDPGETPTAASVADWLAVAWQGLASVTGTEPWRAWVEAAATAEVWIAGPDRQTSRSRTLCWARVEPGPRPIQVASRTWAGLRPSGWAEVAQDRWTKESQGGAGAGTGRASVLFNPECAAMLVRAVVNARLSGSADGVVGRAFRVATDPLGADRLLGRKFDDAGFPAQPVLLADGERWQAAPPAEGHYQRPSYRDPPQVLLSSLVVLTRPEAPPGRCLLVSGQTLHVLGPTDWRIEIDAAPLVDGRPGPRLSRRYIRTSPADLARSCVAAIGPPRTSYLGDASPALLFEGLEIAN